MDTLLTIVHVVVCLFLVGIVLLQHGKGADIGATFGGSSQSLFGTEGPLPLLNKITTAIAVLFMVTSVWLAYISSETSKSSVMSGVGISQPAAEQVAPLVAEEVAEEKPAETVAEPIEAAKSGSFEEAVEKSVTQETAKMEQTPAEETATEVAPTEEKTTETKTE